MRHSAAESPEATVLSPSHAEVSFSAAPAPVM